MHKFIRDFKVRFGVDDLDIVALRHHFGMAGHVSRVCTQDNSRLVGAIFKYRDYERLDGIAADNYGRQLHGKKLRVWRWERPLAKYAKQHEWSSWHDMAQDKRFWLSNLDHFARWTRLHRA